MARILLDAFYHQMPGHRIGDNIAVGGYAVNFGRYTPGDCYHPNGFSFTHADLAPEYDIRLLREPYSDKALADADILLITNPDYPLYEGASPYRWTPQDVDALLRFAERGGGVLLLVNSFLSRPDYWEENFDYERVSLLFDRIGVRWDPNYMSDDKTIELAQSGDYRIGYGQGGRVFNAQLPAGVEPLITFQGNIYGFQTNIGKGKLVVIGDTGMISNGLICFPGFDNAAFFRETFHKLTPAWSAGSPTCWDYTRYGLVSAAPSETGLNARILRNLRPDAEWMPDQEYRHMILTWPTECGLGEGVWQHSPVALDRIAGAERCTAPLRWLSLDGKVAGPEMHLDVAVNATRSRQATDVHIIGRAQSGALTWADLCADPQPMEAGGQIEQMHVVFEMSAVLDADGRPRSARWAQGQILYARNTASHHYGYEIILNSEGGIIAPRAQ